MNWKSGNTISTSILVVAAAVFVLSACTNLPKPAKPPQALPTTIKYKQNWSPEEQHKWWTASQGSRLIPKAWLDKLEAPDSTTLFMAASHFDKFGYIKENKDKIYPIGFAADTQSDENLGVTRLRWFAGQDDTQPWIGLNCAACHTNEISYAGRTERIDGAPTLADFQSFTDALLKAMDQTLADDAKWRRFAARVVGARRPGERDDSRIDSDTSLLRSALTRLRDHQRLVHRYNDTESVYGHGRLDAVGHILNKVALLNGPGAEEPGGPLTKPQFRGEPDAPVSYPFIWNANQHDFVQWNGIVPNQPIKLGKQVFDIGALVRNTSEVIGVFADVITVPYPNANGYRSSVRVRNLEAMEDQLGRLMSPAWPDYYPKPNGGMVAKGRDLFEQACADCHAPLDRRDTRTPIKAQMTPIWGDGGVGTDPRMVCNAYTFQARGGKLQGTKQRIVDGDPLPARGQTAAFLQTQAVGVLLSNAREIIGIGLRKLFGFGSYISVDAVVEAVGAEDVVLDQPKGWDQRLADCMAASNSPRTPEGDLRILAYKARPLNGIWATAPYLHNGSVRTLYDLLLPPGQRPTSFWVGSREFEPGDVGFVDKEPAPGLGFKFRTTDDNGKPIPGNSNAGHNYRFFDPVTGEARDFLKEERLALVEYMKTL